MLRQSGRGGDESYVIPRWSPKGATVGEAVHRATYSQTRRCINHTEAEPYRGLGLFFVEPLAQMRGRGYPNRGARPLAKAVGVLCRWHA